MNRDHKVTFGGEQTNLHSVWDTGLVELQNLSYSEMAARLGSKITPQIAASWNTADPLVWISESAAIETRFTRRPAAASPTSTAISTFQL